MAFVTSTKRGSFEIRESVSTPKGPRSKTLATFAQLTDETIAKARARSGKELSAEELRAAARRAGAPVARPPVERAARELIAELGKGRRLDPPLREMLLDLLRPGGDEERPPRHGATSDAARSVTQWMAATPAERGKALVDLLLLADALPPNARRDRPLRYPRLESSGR